jgi:signal transduction histidine kinase
VLVVDDEDSVLVTIQGVLDLDGYRVVAVSSGQRALELIRAESFDAALIDVRLGDRDGLEILRELRRVSPDTAAIVLTGYASVDSAVAALREGAYDYLPKPCDVFELRTTVRRGLERFRLARQLRERTQEIKALDEFVANVSHDLKAPLTFIKGLAALRRRRAVHTPETAPLLDALQQIEASATKMARQLDELVDASRLESGAPLELRREPTNLIALAKQAVAEHQLTTDRHTLVFDSTLPELVGMWDTSRIERVLANLLGNAIKFSPRGGGIRVSVELEGECAVLRVADQGEGIPEADLPHIFERFHRGRNVEGRIPGTGIGLAGVGQILELHGGAISATSRVGEGTTFTVRLPLNRSD